jgi:hypothetical protein
MKTVEKAVSVLGQFSMSRTKIGPSGLARMARRDKSVTHQLPNHACVININPSQVLNYPPLCARRAKQSFWWRRSFV